ncbi:MAG: hypothetical protein K6T88_09795 [Bacillus sp. (in: Bacteria)]|nr:hypothetical protein [Bacillus sp. (in: firmicutes)]
MDHLVIKDALKKAELAIKKYLNMNAMGTVLTVFIGDNETTRTIPPVLRPSPWVHGFW